MAAMVGRIALILTALGGAYVVALWFVLAVWTFRDIESRSRSVVTQVFSTLLVILFFVPGVLLYLILRPKETLDEAFQRSLEEEYLLQDLEELPLCTGCHRYVEDDFVLCPHCHAQLREPCVACSRLVDLRWALCPYCGSVQGGRVEAGERVEAPAARWTAPALRRRRVTEVRRKAAEALVAGADRLPEGASSDAEEVARREEAVAVAANANPGETAGPTIRPFDRFSRRLDAAADQTATGMLNGTTNGNGDAPPTRNGHGRTLTRRGRFVRATTHGGNGWSSGTNGHAANGHGAVAESAAEGDVGRLEPLPAGRNWSTADEARESALVDAGRRRS